MQGRAGASNRTTSRRLVLAPPHTIQRIAVQKTRRNAIPAHFHGRMLGLRPGRRINAVIRTNYRREDLVSAAEYVLDEYVLEGLDPVEARPTYLQNQHISAIGI